MLRRAEQSSSTSKKTMVPTAGLEPAQVAPLAPQTSASTNFATSACLWPDGQKSSWAAPNLFMGCAQTFLGVRQGEPRQLAALRAGENNTFAAQSLRRRRIRGCRLRCRRARRRRRGRECRRRRFCRRSSFSLCGTFQHRGGRRRRVRTEIRQRQTGDEKQTRKHRGQLRKQCARTARTEHRARCTRAESGARFGALAPLQQHQCDNHQCKQYMHAQDQTTQHKKISLVANGRSRANLSKLIGAQRRAAHQSTIHIGHCEKLCRVAGLDAAAVQNA